jgi:hypothetical protein
MHRDLPVINRGSAKGGFYERIKVASVGVEGLGYAINIDQAMPIIEGLIETLLSVGRR